MSDFIKKYWLISGTFVLVGWFFFRFFQALVFPSGSLATDGTAKLMPDSSLQQLFRSDRSHLKRIEILFGPRQDYADQTIAGTLAEADCQTILRTGVFTQKPTMSEKIFRFDFPEIIASEDETYCLVLKYEAKAGAKRGISLATRSASDPIVISPLSGQNIDPDDPARFLVLRPGYVDGSVWKNLDELNQRLSQYKPFFLKHYYLYAISFLFVALSLLLIIILIAS